MEALKAELARKRKARAGPGPGVGASANTHDANNNNNNNKKRYRSRGEVERERLERERKLERSIASRKGYHQGDQGSGDQDGCHGVSGGDRHDGDHESMIALASSSGALAAEEVKRKLRLLKQPATLFGESEVGRRARLVRVERELVVEDAYAVGQQSNTFLEIQKEEEQERLRMLRREAARVEKGDLGASAKGTDVVAYKREQTEQERTMAAFKKAAERVKAERLEATMPLGEAVAHYVKRMTKEWEEDLDSKPDAYRETGEGRQSILQLRATQKAFLMLYDRIDQKTLAGDFERALGDMVASMRRRDYRAASESYVHLSIGNSPWPIGVTSVGIHDRSAREKISFSQNGQAHIMNDEGTRKILFAWKRLMTWIQAAYPAQDKSLAF